jgi:hypothetical protein
MSGENEVLPKNLEADIRSRDQTYGPKCHNGRTALSPDVRLVCDKESYFHQLSHSSCFLVIKLCFSRNRTDNRSFPSIRGYGVSRKLHGGALRLG